MNRVCSTLSILMMALVWVPAAAVAAGDGSDLTLGTSFTYHGELKQRGVDADGVYDFEFELWDRAAGGQFLGSTTRFGHPVSAGVFSVDLDFGHSITGVTRWLEIHVREAGGETFSVLTPRQKLEGAKTTACTVDSDLVVNGDIGTKGERLGFLDASGGELMGFGTYELFNLDYLTLRTGDTDQIYLGPTGNLGVGIPPTVPLDVVGGTDASLGGGGYVVIGPQNDKNIVIDNNEIIARNNTAVSTLYLNNDGGDVVTGSDLVVGGDLAVGGGLGVGYQIVDVVCGGATQNWCTATCPAGKKVIGGGCFSSAGGIPPITHNYPMSNTQWHCGFQIAVPNATLFHAHAICARIQ